MSGFAPEFLLAQIDLEDHGPIKHPEVVVYLGDLLGPSGNAYAVLGAVQSALYQAGVPKADQAAYTEAAMSGDYSNLLRVTDETVTAIVSYGGFPESLKTFIDSEGYDL